MIETKSILPSRFQRFDGTEGTEWPAGVKLDPVFMARLTPGEVTRNFLVRHAGDVLPVGLAHFALRVGEAWTSRVYPELTDLDGGPVRDIDTAAALLCGGPHGADSYVHWLIDYLPRLWVLEQAGAPDLPLIVNEHLAPWQLDSLLVFAPTSGLILKPSAERLRVADLWAPSFMSRTGVVHPEVIEFLRRALDHVPLEAVQPEKVYLTRRGVKERALDVEPEIARMLERRGFAVFAPHEMPFLHQVRMMASAKVIVLPHGGALANLAFAPAGATVIEIATKPRHTLGPSLAAACGHRHRHVLPGPRLVADLAALVDGLRPREAMVA